MADLLFVDAGSFLVSAGSLSLIRRSFNAVQAPGTEPAARTAILDDIKTGLRFVWSHPVLRTISIMMALINFVGATTNSQLVLFAKRTLAASDSQVALLFTAGAAGIVVFSLCAAPIRRHLSFAVTALGALIVSGLAVIAMALVGRYLPALVLWALASGLGLMVNVNTGSLRQAIVPSHLYGRVISIAGVLAWSTIPLGALAGAAAIQISGSVAGVYAVVGGLTALSALTFAFSPLRHGDRYLAEAAAEAASATPPVPPGNAAGLDAPTEPAR